MSAELLRLLPPPDPADPTTLTVVRDRLTDADGPLLPVSWVYLPLVSPTPGAPRAWLGGAVARQDVRPGDRLAVPADPDRAPYLVRVVRCWLVPGLRPHPPTWSVLLRDDVTSSAPSP